ncbi:ATP-binding cassette domain-containing protein [Streptomyces sp. KL116D]|uniref:ATP-binding cassette domain-containing protein n=1 Tax=Streptomyces sp. KL116D TaxID=3045152 RepID=UPI0035572217
MSEPLLQTRDLTRHFKVGTGLSAASCTPSTTSTSPSANARSSPSSARAAAAESTLARLVAQVHKPTRGEIRYRGKPLTALRGRKERLAYRGDVPMVSRTLRRSQPAYRVSHGILRGHHPAPLPNSPAPSGRRRPSGSSRSRRPRAADVLGRFPYELSGGQRQRIGFAQAHRAPTAPA